MRNIMIMAIIAFTMVGFTTFSFAEKQTKFLGKSQVIVTGTVESINKDKNVFVIKDVDTARRSTLRTNASKINSLSVGQAVEVVYENGLVLSIK